jgi:hypothetical protein
MSRLTEILSTCAAADSTSHSASIPPIRSNIPHVIPCLRRGPNPQNARGESGHRRPNSQSAHTKADAPVPITAPFGRASTEAITSIRMEPTIAIPHRKKIAFDNGTVPNSGKFPEDPGHTQSDLRSRPRSIRNAADRPRFRTFTTWTALKSLSAQVDS